jgi:DNA polymerase III sliding clamp (beta) subunit (PCNA family)
MAFNTRFVLDAIKPVKSENLEIRFQEGNKPITISHENFTALVMPMRI